jgi:nitroreductase
MADLPALALSDAAPFAPQAGESPASILTPLRTRRAVRAFLKRPPPVEIVFEVLEAARWAPSGVNMQPWTVEVVMGASLERLRNALEAAAGEPPRPDYHYYPKEWREPFNTRRMEIGSAIYRTYGRMRRAEMTSLHRKKNLRFFDAPVVLLIFMPRGLEAGSWLDCGMFVQSALVAAEACGLATCPQASSADYPDVVRSTLSIAPDRAYICNVAMGYADLSEPINRVERTRVDVPSFVTFHQ